MLIFALRPTTRAEKEAEIRRIQGQIGVLERQITWLTEKLFELNISETFRYNDFEKGKSIIETAERSLRLKADELRRLLRNDPRVTQCEREKRDLESFISSAKRSQSGLTGHIERIKSEKRNATCEMNNTKRERLRLLEELTRVQNTPVNDMRK